MSDLVPTYRDNGIAIITITTARERVDPGPEELRKRSSRSITTTPGKLWC